MMVGEVLVSEDVDIGRFFGNGGVEDGVWVVVGWRLVVVLVLLLEMVEGFVVLK